LTNVLRHAAARRLVVRLHFHGDERFVMTLGDDGRGYDVRAVLAGGMSEKNVGLHGMLERAELMGGQLRFRSSIGHGSVLRLSL
jgi:signal transduction histidine kinase